MLKNKKKNYNPKLSRIKRIDFGSGTRIIIKGYSKKNLARSRRKLHRKSDEERIILKKAMAKHKRAIINAGYDPKKYINIPD